MDSGLIVTAALVIKIGRQRKTETRRLMGLEEINKSPDDWELESCERGEDGFLYATFRRFNEDDPPQWLTKEIACPYGGPEDTLWVRENWYVGKGYDGRKPRELDTSGHVLVGWLADGPKADWGGKTRSAIHLPRAFARYVLKITDLKVERLHDITEKSVKAEGAGGEVRQMALYGLDAEGIRKVYRSYFADLWRTINGPDSWEPNPWVWVITFTLVKQTT